MHGLKYLLRCLPYFAHIGKMFLSLRSFNSLEKNIGFVRRACPASWGHWWLPATHDLRRSQRRLGLLKESDLACNMLFSTLTDNYAPSENGRSSSSSFHITHIQAFKMRTGFQCTRICHRCTGKDWCYCSTECMHVLIFLWIHAWLIMHIWHRGIGQSNIFGCLVQAGSRTFPFQSWLHHDQNSRMSNTRICPLRLLSHFSSGIWLRYRSKLNRIAVLARSFWGRIIWCEVGLCLRTFWWMVPSKLAYLSHFNLLSPCLWHVFASSPHITCTKACIYLTECCQNLGRTRVFEKQNLQYVVSMVLHE